MDQLIFKARNTTLEMLTDRGYKVLKKLHISKPEFSKIKKFNNYNFFVQHKTKEEILYVIFHTRLKNMSKQEFKTLYLSLVEKKYKFKMILIFPNKNTTLNKEISKPEYNNVTIFLLNELSFNIMKHECMPKKIFILSDEEKENLKQKYNTELKYFNKMFTHDPLARYYDLQQGDVIKIIRKSDITGESIGYRYLI